MSESKHKNYEWIVAFAEGKEVEYFYWRLSNGEDSAWIGVTSLDTFDYDYHFRIKPKEVAISEAEMLDTIKKAGYCYFFDKTARLVGDYSKQDLQMIIKLMEKGYKDERK